MTSVIPEASTTTPDPTEQRDHDSARAARIDQFVDRIMAALAEPTPTEALQAIAAEHSLQVEEWDDRGLDESLRGKLLAHYFEHKDGRRILVVRKGQDPTERLHAVRALLHHQGVIA
jgi:hypothetical protein